MNDLSEKIIVIIKNETPFKEVFLTKCHQNIIFQ